MRHSILGCKGGHGCFLVFVVSCVGSVLCDEQRSPIESACVCACLTVCDQETSAMRTPRPNLGCRNRNEILSVHFVCCACVRACVCDV